MDHQQGGTAPRNASEPSHWKRGRIPDVKHTQSALNIVVAKQQEQSRDGGVGG